MFAPSFVDTQLAEAQEKANACNCQANGGTCMTGRCPCHKRHEACTRMCKCSSIICNGVWASSMKNAARGGGVRKSREPKKPTFGAATILDEYEE